MIFASAGAAVLLALCASAASAADRGRDAPFVPVALERVAVAATVDPLGVWTPEEMTEDPRGSDVYAGAMRRGNETVIVSQLVSAGCGSPSNCPVRVLLAAADGTRRVLLGQEQACAASSHFALSSDLSALRACDQVLPLAALGEPPEAAPAPRAIR